MSDRVSIRQATRDDVGAIAAIFQQDELRTDAPADIEEYRDAFSALEGDANNRLFVAERGGVVIATFQLTFIAHLMWRGRRVAQVESMHVAAEHRGCGVGEHMMQWVIAEARSAGCVRVQLTSNKLRSRAHRFYERLGFEHSHEGFKLYL